MAEQFTSWDYKRLMSFPFEYSTYNDLRSRLFGLLQFVVAKGEKRSETHVFDGVSTEEMQQLVKEYLHQSKESPRQPIALNDYVHDVSEDAPLYTFSGFRNKMQMWEVEKPILLGSSLL